MSFFPILFISILINTSIANPPSCKECESLQSTIDDCSSKEKTTQEELIEKQKERENLSSTDVSKKMKLTSNILVLVSRIETFQNKKNLAKMKLKKMKCSTCSTADSEDKPETPPAQSQ